MPLSSLKIHLRSHREPRTEADPDDGQIRRAEFIINDIPLSEALEVERDSLAFLCSPLDSMDPVELATYRLTLLGQLPPSTQLGSDRIVFYGCHCGLDYCGVISARLVPGADIMRWHDVGYEDTTGFRPDHPHIAEVSFSTDQYRGAVEEFFGLRK